MYKNVTVKLTTADLEKLIEQSVRAEFNRKVDKITFNITQSAGGELTLENVEVSLGQEKHYNYSTSYFDR